MKDVPKINSDAWVDKYGDALFHFALARVNKRDIAEDLVQETFLAAVKSQERFKGQSSEKTWLFGILKHKVAPMEDAKLTRMAPAPTPKRAPPARVMTAAPGRESAAMST